MFTAEFGVGYYRPVKHYNQGKIQEFQDRIKFNFQEESDEVIR